MYKIIGADHQEYGPVSAEQIRQWVMEGRANGQTLVRAEDSAEWKPLSAYPDFAGAVYQPDVFSASPAMPPNAQALGAQILTGEPDFDFGLCLGRSWELLMKNFGLLVGTTFVVWLIVSGIQFVPILGMAALLLKGILYGGLYTVYLNRIRGQPASVGDAFSGFKISALQLLLAGLLTKLLSVIGFCFCMLPGIYLTVAWILTLPLVVDKKLEFWSAMELSRKVVTRLWFKFFLFLLVVFAPFMVAAVYGMIDFYSVMLPMLPQFGSPPNFNLDPAKMEQLTQASHVFTLILDAGLLISLPWALGAISYAYEDIFGSRPARSA